MRKKEELYNEEQENIINTLIQLLELDDENSFLLSSFDNSTEKQEQVMALYPQVRKYFSLTNVQAILKPETARRPWLSLIKNVLKEKFKILAVHHRLGNNTFTRKYYLLSKTT